jgi:hypothetical protein
MFSPNTTWIKQVLIKLTMNKMNVNQIAQRSYYCCFFYKLLIIVPLIVVGGPTFIYYFFSLSLFTL